jgi:biopolymer transport protein ExbD
MARRRLGYASIQDEGGLDLTSLLDVIFNLLFFFILATSIRTDQSYLEITLPQAREGAPQLPEKKRLPEIYVTKEGTLALDGKTITPEDLLAQLKESVEKDGVERAILSADADASVQQSVNAMDIIRRAGINKVAQRVKSP